MKILVLLIVLLWSVACNSFPWFFGNDGAVLIPNKIFHVNSSGAQIDFTGDGIKLKPSGTNEIDFSLSGTDFKWDVRGTDVLTLQDQNSGQALQVELYSNDGDKTDSNGFRIYGSGTPSAVTNAESVFLGYDSSSDEYLLKSENFGTGVLQPLVIQTGTNDDQIFLDTDGDIGVSTNTPTATLDIDGGVAVTDAGIDPNNLLRDGGFDSSASGNGLTCTVGTCTQELTTKFIGKGALEIALSAQSANVTKCYDNTNAEWDNQMIQIEGWVKSSASGVEMCYAANTDGSSEGNCITYDASDEWRKIKVIEQVTTENDVCLKIKSGSLTDSIFLDSAKITELKVDGTTKVKEQFVRYNTRTDEGTGAGTGAGEYRIPYFTNEEYNTGDTELLTISNSADVGFSATANEDVTVEMIYAASFNAENFGISLNASATAGSSANIQSLAVNERIAMEQTVGAGETATVSVTVPMKAGDVIRPHNGNYIGQQNNNTWAVTINATKYDQKSVLSDATAESTITEWEAYTPGSSWLPDVDVTPTGLWRRVGDTMEVFVELALTGAPPTAELTVDIPTGYTIDTSKILDTTSGVGAYLGILSMLDGPGGVVDYIGRVGYEDTNSVKALVTVSSGTYSAPTNVTQATPFTAANGDFYRFSFKVPITGWKAKPQIVGTFKAAVDYAAREDIAATSVAVTTNTYLDFPDNVSDADSHFTGCGSGHTITQGAGCRYIVPEDGDYFIGATIAIGTNQFTSNDTNVLSASVNGTAVCTDRDHWDYTSDGTSITKTLSLANCIRPLVKDDVVEALYFHSAAGAHSLTGPADLNRFNVIRIDQAGRLTQAEVQSQYDLTVTSALTGWSTVSAHGMPYKVSTGDWRLRFNIYGTVTAASRSSGSVAVSGVRCTNISLQSIAASQSDGGVAVERQFMQDSGGTCNAQITHATGTTDWYLFSGDIAVDGKPTFVP